MTSRQRSRRALAISRAVARATGPVARSRRIRAARISLDESVEFLAATSKAPATYAIIAGAKQRGGSEVAGGEPGRDRAESGTRIRVAAIIGREVGKEKQRRRDHVRVARERSVTRRNAVRAIDVWPARRSDRARWYAAGAAKRRARGYSRELAGRVDVTPETRQHGRVRITIRRVEIAVCARESGRRASRAARRRSPRVLPTRFSLADSGDNDESMSVMATSRIVRRWPCREQCEACGAHARSRRAVGLREQLEAQRLCLFTHVGVRACGTGEVAPPLARLRFGGRDARAGHRGAHSVVVALSSRGSELAPAARSSSQSATDGRRRAARRYTSAALSPIAVDPAPAPAGSRGSRDRVRIATRQPRARRACGQWSRRPERGQHERAARGRGRRTANRASSTVVSSRSTRFHPPQFAAATAESITTFGTACRRASYAESRVSVASPRPSGFDHGRRRPHRRILAPGE